MDDMPPLTNEPEFWTILKTPYSPYKEPQSRATFMFQGNGVSRGFYFTHNINYPTIAVHVNNKGGSPYGMTVTHNIVTFVEAPAENDIIRIEVY